jgi:hypothetical protein
MTSPRSPLRQAALLFLLIGTMSTLILIGHIYQSWGRKGILEPSGGRYFFQRVELAVPSFRQSDERWRRDLLGPTPNTLGAEGCAVSSAAMVLASYGYDTDPQRLNNFLKRRGGYTPQGWLYWEKAAELAHGHVRHAYEDLPSYDLIDGNLQRGNPVIVRLRLPSRITHFVVIAGKQGFDYLIRDPGAGAAKGLYPLREFGSRIEALRFYEKLP